MTQKIYTTAEVAAQIGISIRGVLKLAQAHSLGQKHGKRVLIFTNKDIEVMQGRKGMRGHRVGKKMSG